MQDRQLYEQILGIGTPWRVERVELRLEEGEVHVYLAHDSSAIWACPECGQDCGLYDHQPDRSWRHLDTCQYRTILHAELPRVDCPEHGPRVARADLDGDGHLRAAGSSGLSVLARLGTSSSLRHSPGLAIAVRLLTAFQVFGCSHRVLWSCYVPP